MSPSWASVNSWQSLSPCSPSQWIQFGVAGDGLDIGGGMDVPPLLLFFGVQVVVIVVIEHDFWW